MDKFSKIIKPVVTKTEEDSNVLWENKYLKVLNLEDWTVVEEKDMVVCIIHLVEENKIILRQEYIPTYKYIDGQEYHVTVLSGSIEQNETPNKALFREIEEEAGIVIRQDYQLEFEKSLFVSKGNTAKYHISLVELVESDYHEISAKGDGSEAEKMSKCIKLDVKYINNIIPSDVITELLLCKMKKTLGL